MIKARYSQHLDLSHDEHKLKGCGIACLAMLLGDQSPGLDELYHLGLEQGAYISGVGWSHTGLVNLAKHFGLDNSRNYDLAALSLDEAITKLKTELKNGPVVVSVFPKFDPGSRDGHLVILLSLSDAKAEVLDPDTTDRTQIRQTIPADRFLNAWKKRLIVVRE